MSENLVLYVSYGSNLLIERFLCYIQGGAVAGSSWSEAGARDQTLPKQKRALRLPGKVFMSGESSRWGAGGCAFFDPNQTDAYSLMAGYLITEEQFLDVTAQENCLPVGSLSVDLSQVVDNGEMRLPVGSAYSRILYLGTFDSYPAFTFTSPMGVSEHTLNPASVKYMNVIKRGLKETFSELSDENIESYLELINSRH